MGNQALANVQLGFELPEEVHRMDQLLRDGSPTHGWRGDPRLYLHMGLIKATKFGYDKRANRVLRKGDVAGWCWVVMRHNEDGTDLPIMQVKGTELPYLLERLITLDPRTPGHETTMDKVEREDREVQKQREHTMAENIGEHLDHLWRLVDERQNGRHTTRQVGGMDENPYRNLEG